VRCEYARRRRKTERKLAEQALREREDEVSRDYAETGPRLVLGKSMQTTKFHVVDRETRLVQNRLDRIGTGGLEHALDLENGVGGVEGFSATLDSRNVFRDIRRLLRSPLKARPNGYVKARAKTVFDADGRFLRLSRAPAPMWTKHSSAAQEEHERLRPTRIRSRATMNAEYDGESCAVAG